MLNATLYVPAAKPVTVCGAFHCWPGRPSISTVAPMGIEETINCPSLGAGGATGAAAAYLADLPARAGAGADADVVRDLPCSSCAAFIFSIACSALRPNGAGVFAADCDGAPASSSTAGCRWNTSANTTITHNPPTTAATTFQW